MKNLWRESNKNHWGDKVNASGHFKTGFMKKYSDPAELGALKDASVSKTSQINENRMEINKISANQCKTNRNIMEFNEIH